MPDPSGSGFIKEKTVKKYTCIRKCFIDADGSSSRIFFREGQEWETDRPANKVPSHLFLEGTLDVVAEKAKAKAKSAKGKGKVEPESDEEEKKDEAEVL
jgi:hypothetical protein